METRDLIKQIIENERKSFIPQYQAQATDAECLGMALSHYFGYDGLPILQTCYSALEDANWHSVNEIFEVLTNSEDPDGAAKKLIECARGE